MDQNPDQTVRRFVVNSMYVDVTPEFRDLVKGLTARSEELGLVIPPRDKSRILDKSNGPTRQAESIVKTVTSLADLLNQHRHAYLENMASAGAGTSAMSEADRNQVDAGADNIAKQCRNLIVKYKEDIAKMDTNVSAKEHYESVCSGLDTFLQSVVGVHSQMRAVRVSRMMQMKKLSRLEVTSVESRAAEIGPQHPPVSEQELREKAVSAAASSNRPSTFWDESNEDEEMTQEEAAMMELENERLMDHLSSLQNQVDQVQSKVVKIAELQSIFTEKVLQQAENLEKVHENTVASTENIKGGNEAVRQAIQNKATYRVYILFIILVFSFSLLFLDWYNP